MVPEAGGQRHDRQNGQEEAAAQPSPERQPAASAPKSPDLSETEQGDGLSGKLLIPKPPRGTRDILPEETPLWQHLELITQSTLKNAGYKEIRVPIFEHTELFKRSVGETTDIVNKEMYTFADKSDRSLTLRPEGTAGVVRAYMHGSLHRQTQPVKLWYLGPMFRYEGTQTGRQRQFHQVGLEAFGSAGPLIDAEVIVVALEYLKRAGLTDFDLQLNSIGCPVCRPAYRELLRSTLAPKLASLCADCQDRFQRNPLRMLDCKSKHCQAQYQDVPASLDHLCNECQAHWGGLISLLEQERISYLVNKRLVRGLDYYTRTVFEVVSRDSRLGAQSTILAGGRYDNLVEMFGGPPTAAVGWALGLERLCLLLASPGAERPFAFIVSSSPAKALEIASALRSQGVSCELDFPQRGTEARSFTKQLQQANKLGAAWAVIAGEDELASGEVTLKDMKAGGQNRVPLASLSGLLIERSGSGRPGKLTG